jgi:putative transposase
LASAEQAAADASRLRLVPAAAAGLPERLAGRLDEHLVAFAAHMREGLLAASTAVGLEVMAELVQIEVTELAGPRGKHSPTRAAMRHGTQPGTVTLGGRRLPVRRPRVRSVGAVEHELALESYRAFTSTDLLAEGIVARMLAGLSTRRYAAGLEPVGAEVDEQAAGTSKSAVSRRFVAVTTERLEQLLARRLDEQRWLIVFLDGFGFGEHLLVGALGVTDDGAKIPLGVAEGATENAAVCTRLVSDLAERGLDASRGVLFVVDGGNPDIRATHSNSWCPRGCRCWEHQTTPGAGTRNRGPMQHQPPTVRSAGVTVPPPPPCTSPRRVTPAATSRAAARSSQPPTE